MSETVKVRAVIVSWVFAVLMFCIGAVSLLVTTRSFAALPERVGSLEQRVSTLEQELKAGRTERLTAQAKNEREHAEIMGDIKRANALLERIERKLP
jgi:hypothetical protein